MALADKELETSNEFATPIDWAPRWDIGAPMPQIFSNGRKVYLIYLIDEPEPDWDGTYTTMISTTDSTAYLLALVEFDGRTFRFGIANDEVFTGLPLWDKGLKSYGAHIVQNSNWIAEVKKINQVHYYYNEERWKEFNHYILLFHDEIVEVIAKSYRVEIFKSSFKQLAAEVARRMNT